MQVSGETKETTDFLFLSDCLYQHNHYRKLHGVPILTYDREALDLARTRALEMSKTVSDDPNSPYSNYTLNWSYIPGTKSPSCKALVAQWYKGVHYYSFAKGLVPKKVEPFAKLIWRRSKKIGCAQVTNDNEQSPGIYTVCVYTPKADLKTGSLENISPISNPSNYYNFYLLR